MPDNKRKLESQDTEEAQVKNAKQQKTSKGKKAAGKGKKEGFVATYVTNPVAAAPAAVVKAAGDLGGFFTRGYPTRFAAAITPAAVVDRLVAAKESFDEASLAKKAVIVLGAPVAFGTFAAFGAGLSVLSVPFAIELVRDVAIATLFGASGISLTGQVLAQTAGTIKNTKDALAYLEEADEADEADETADSDNDEEMTEEADAEVAAKPSKKKPAAEDAVYTRTRSADKEDKAKPAAEKAEKTKTRSASKKAKPAEVEAEAEVDVAKAATVRRPKAVVVKRKAKAAPKAESVVSARTRSKDAKASKPKA